ncbi:MAG TPA: putative Ig domain-containing protein, partial [Candidatus Gemmiger excrementipullorum]|nr:putative Ig domain-containing protein [Candidatus Gemmiger excrementipullorum]
MKKRILSLLCVLALCLGLLPVTALAAAEGEPAKLYVGDQNVRSGEDTTYWTTDASGGLTKSSENDAWSVKYEPGTATLTLRGATINGAYDATSLPFGAGIYAQGRSNQAVALTIELIGTNTITGIYGIYLHGHQGGTVSTNASLSITGDGSLTVTGTTSYGLHVISGTGNASLTIEDASVVASSSSSYSHAGVCVQSGADATNSPELSLAVNGGSLTASASEGNDGIQFYVGSPSDTTNATTSLTISDNAIVDARNGGIRATSVSTELPTPTPTGDNSSGIVFDGTEGTVYGNVTLDESLNVGEGETLTIPEGSTLTVPEGATLTNNGTIVNKGTMNGDPTGGSGTVVSTPTITTASLPEGTVGTEYNQPLAATGNNITWSSSDLPAGLTLDADTGTITGTPATEGQFSVKITATNSAGIASKEYTLNIKAV